jgi:hypothetical protein
MQGVSNARGFSQELGKLKAMIHPLMTHMPALSRHQGVREQLNAHNTAVNIVPSTGWYIKTACNAGHCYTNKHINACRVQAL